MLTAVIDETQCVGCSKCIHACPVDAIVGTLHHTHTVLLDECIGCKLCIAPCPVDCIKSTPLKNFCETIDKPKRAQKAKYRYQQRQQRLLKQQQKMLPFFSSAAERKVHIQQNIQDALLRYQQKKQLEHLTENAHD